MVFVDIKVCPQLYNFKCFKTHTKPNSSSSSPNNFLLIILKTVMRLLLSLFWWMRLCGMVCILFPNCYLCFRSSFNADINALILWKKNVLKLYRELTNFLKLFEHFSGVGFPLASLCESIGLVLSFLDYNRAILLVYEQSYVPSTFICKTVVNAFL